MKNIELFLVLTIVLLFLFTACQGADSSNIYDKVENKVESNQAVIENKPKCEVIFREDIAYGGQVKCVDNYGTIDANPTKCQPDGRFTSDNKPYYDVYSNNVYCDENDRCQKNTRLSMDCSKLGASYTCLHENLEAAKCIDTCTAPALLANFDSLAECHYWFESK